ncbi:hypothetical protein HZS_6956, partial [Henneguya salminicola]
MEVQYPKKRYKRDYFGGDVPKKPPFNDPLYDEQWYLNDEKTELKLDINVIPAWNKGLSGSGTMVTYFTSNLGIEHNHTDLFKNYDPNASWDINDEDSDPFPRYDPHDENKHGTRCAGEVAATANNRICGVGVAFNSRIGGVRMLDGHVTDKVEAASLSLNPQYIDIYSSSWGPNDDGKTVEGPGTLALAALLNGINNGRMGLGSIYVWASGNGGHHDDDCNCDGYANSIYTISISSATDQGDVPWYSETCASTIASTLSSGTYLQRRIITTDLHNTCTLNHTGTSASAPIAAGVFALLLEANRKLTWRDVQHLCVYTSNWKSLIQAGNWTRNYIGLYFHQKFGFGLLDTAKLIDWARDTSWVTSPPKYICTSQTQFQVLTSKSEINIYFFVDGCKNTDREINYVEHTQITISVDYSTRRGDIFINIHSPSGTISPILDKRNEDDSTVGFINWTMTTVHFWGENPKGQWIIKFKDDGGYMTANVGVVKFCTLTIHGTRDITAYQLLHSRYQRSTRQEIYSKKTRTAKAFYNRKKAYLSSNNLEFDSNSALKTYLNYMEFIQYQNRIQ